MSLLNMDFHFYYASLAVKIYIRKVGVFVARMKKKTNKKTKRTKRLFFVTIFCLAINAYVLYSVGIIFKDVYEKKHEKKLLVAKLDNLKEEQDKIITYVELLFFCC